MTDAKLRRGVVRVIAAVSAVIWGVLDFGIIDLVTAVFRDPVFAEHYLLELGWGLLYLVLVAVPFAALAVRPGTALWLCQLGIAAVSLALAALVAGKPGHLVPALLIAVTAGSLWTLSGVRPPAVTWRSRRLLAVAAVGAVPWGWYAVAMARSTFNDEITNGLAHFPAQGALGLSLVLGSVLLAATDPSTPGRLLEAVVLSGSALALGAESVVNPGLVGSLGVVGGLAAAVWSLALLAAVLVPGGGRSPVTQES